MRELNGYIGRHTIKITGADNVNLLNKLSTDQIQLLNVTYLSDLDLEVTVSKCNLQKLIRIAERHGASVKVIHSKGIGYLFQSMFRRPVLLTFVVLLLFFSLFLPTRIFFVSVEGNDTVPTKRIVEAAERSGIRFGTSRRKVRSEVMKNALLQQIPELQWAGINTSGCTAQISVREKTETDGRAINENQVCSIVASRDGVVQDCTIYQGNPLCTPGQAVKAGQILVSGYTDCGLLTKATRADAEIKALTFRSVSALSPNPSMIRGEIISQKTRFRLRIGKKLIKLQKDSGNLDVSCVKIYSEEYVYLPGGFRLPIALIKERQIVYAPIKDATTVTQDTNWIEDYVKSHLQSVMIAGTIVSAETQIETQADVNSLQGKYVCLEMIGQVKYEQTILKDENK